MVPVENKLQAFIYILASSVAILVTYIFFASSETSMHSIESRAEYKQIAHSDAVLQNRNNLSGSSLKSSALNSTEQEAEIVLSTLHNQETVQNPQASVDKNLYESADSKDNLMDDEAYSELQSQIRSAILQQLHLTDEETVSNTALADIGLISSDVIIAVNNFSFAQLKEAPAALESYIAGPQTVIEVDRDGGYYKYTFVLDSVED